MRNDLAGNKHDKVFAALQEITKNDAELADQLLILFARYKEIKKLEIVGALSAEDSFKHRANLNLSLLNFIALAAPLCPVEGTGKVFISYSHADTAIANLIKNSLTANNIDVVMDSDKLMAGMDIASFINESIRQTNVTLSIISKKSLLSSWVAMESIATFQQEKSTNSHRFIGCFIDKDFFSKSFTDDAIGTINEELSKLLEYKKKRIDQGLNTRDLDNEFLRYNNLKLNIDEIIRRLRENLCVDVSEPALEASLPKIITAIRGTII